MVMSYGLNNRSFLGLDLIFPEGNIRRIRGENLVSSHGIEQLEDTWFLKISALVP